MGGGDFARFGVDLDNSNLTFEREDEFRSPAQSQIETKLLGKILGEQKLRVVRFIAANANAEGFLFATVAQICEGCDATKPTVINALKMLEEKKAIKPLKRGLYKIFL